MALSIILRSSASRFINVGNRVYANLIVPGASVASLRLFCSSPSLDGDAKRPLDESVVNNLMSQVEMLQREIESLRKSYCKPVCTREEAEERANDESDDDDDDSDVDKSNGDGDFESNKDESTDDDGAKKSDESNDEALSETDGNGSNSDGEGDGKALPKSKENEELIRGIEKEIEAANNFMALSAPDATIPVDFPFTIKDDYPGSSSILLSREYEEELVEVTVENPTVYGDNYRKGYNERKSCPFSMDMTVVVTSLNSGKKVELQCGARPGGISVYAAKDPEDEDDNDGVHMKEFNADLNEEFVKYLEARGIKLSTTDFLYKYMLDKANKERLRILKNIVEMVA